MSEQSLFQKVKQRTEQTFDSVSKFACENKKSILGATVTLASTFGIGYYFFKKCQLCNLEQT
jgi:hypothetical protein